MKKKVLVSISAMALSAMPLFAAGPASDDASDAAYGGGTYNGLNGGTGFNAWVVNASGTGGHFIGDSSNNGGGGSGDINVGGASFGLFDNSGGTTDAIRSFSAGDLLVGETFSIDFDNGFLNGSSAAGFGLRDGGVNEFEFFFAAGTANYQINDSVGGFDTGVGFTADGLSLDFTLTSATTYDLTITPNGGSATNFTGRTLAAGGGIDDVRVFIFNSDTGGASQDVFANSLEIIAVPEPGTLALLGGGLLAIALRRRVRS